MVEGAKESWKRDSHAAHFQWTRAPRVSPLLATDGVVLKGDSRNGERAGLAAR